MQDFMMGLVCWLFMIAGVVGVLLWWTNDLGLLTLIFGMGL